MTLNINLEEVPFAILEVVKARILANRRRLQQGQQQPRPSLRPKPQFVKQGASSKGWRLPKQSVLVLEEIDFAFIDENETYLTGLGGAAPDRLYSQSSLISATNASLQEYKIIRVLIADKDDFCVSLKPEVPIDFFFGYRTADFVRYVRSGGILWINTEYSSCGFPSSQFDAFLANVFGSSMSTNGTTYSANEEFIADPFSFNEPIYFVQKFPLVYEPLAGNAPPIFYTQATALVFGGTPIYGKQIGESGFGAPIAFERIGNGYLVLSGDSNGTTQFPSYSSNGKTFVDALLQLERLRP